jgi:uncharacterized protein (UPF0332 family)
MNEERGVYIAYRLSRALGSLQEAETLASSSHWNACVNRLYYACFYAVSSLLLKKGFSSSKHSGIRSLFNEHYAKAGLIPKETARIYNYLFERRQEGDYEDMVVFTRDEVIPWIGEAKAFVHAVKALVELK